MPKLWIFLTILTVIVIIAFGGLEYLFNDPDDQGLKDFYGEGKVVEDDLRQFYKNRKDYPKYTLDELQQMGAFDGDARGYWVHFTPFSSGTPDNQVVLQLGYGPLGFFPKLCNLSWTKYELTHDPDPAQSPLRDHLEDVRLSQAKALAAERPGTRIISTLAWFEPNESSTGYGELVIDYFQLGDATEHRMHYDLWDRNGIWTVGAAKLLR